MLKRIMMITGMLLLFAGCMPGDIPDEVIQNPDEEEEGEISIVPSNRLSEKNYKTLTPYRLSEARGEIVNRVANRLDIDEMEEGLRRHSIEYFDPDDYYFEEGQYLSKDTISKWLSSKLSEKELEKRVQDEIDYLKRNEMTVNDQVISRIRRNLQAGLNPPRKEISDDMDLEEKKEIIEESPRYVSHILEQNFLQQTEDKTLEISGVSIGIAMKSVYRYQTEIGGPSFYKDISNKEMLEEGKKMAQTILERLREIEDLQNVPIMIAIFREQEQTSLVPGNFVAKTFVEGSDMMLGDWQQLKEEYVLFPSQHAKDNFYDTQDVLQEFGREIAAFFPNYVGYIGEGFYVNDQLEKLTIEIPIDFKGSSEVIGFTQYVYGLIKKSFTGDYDLEIKIESSRKVESIIFQTPEQEEPTVHILH